MANIGVGAFATADRRAIRSTPNPMDKCTIVSLLKKPYVTHKHTLEPGIFHVPAGTPEKPGLLVVGSSSWFLDTDPDRPIAEIVTSSIDVARSIVEDYVSGLLEYDRTGSMPAIFYVMGHHDVKSVLEKFQPEIKRALEYQKTWYQKLVNLADMLWAQSNGNPLTISEDFRVAAHELGLNKPWMANFDVVALIKCILCGSLRDPNYPICGSCNHVVDVDLYNKLGLKPLTK